MQSGGRLFPAFKYCWTFFIAFIEFTYFQWYMFCVYILIELNSFESIIILSYIFKLKMCMSAVLKDVSHFVFDNNHIVSGEIFISNIFLFCEIFKTP